MSCPQDYQEDLYKLPYHWFPEQRLKKFDRSEKQKIIFRLIERYRPSNLEKYLDIGCGDGRWTSDIKKKFGIREACGLDFSEQAVKFARLISPEINFIAHQSGTLPFPDRAFDLVTAIEVIEHVEEKAEQTFVNEIARIVKRDGLVIVTTPSLKLRIPKHHYRHYSVDRLSSLFKQSGMKVLEVHGKSLPCVGAMRWLRNTTSLFPLIWRLWKPTMREVPLTKAIDFLVAARPGE